MAGTQNKTNAGSVFSLNYHLVWCPKYRRKILVGNVVERLKELLREKADQLDADNEALEIMPDHVHLFVSSDPTKAAQYLVNQYKGYTAGSVGHVSEETVRKDIETQEHRS